MTRCQFRSRLWVRPLEERVAPAVFTVMNVSDAGAGSLRQAVLDANTLAGADSIVFDPIAFATPQTIVLTTGEMKIRDQVAVTGPSAKVTIDGNQLGRIFNVDVLNKSGQAININAIALINGKVTGTLENGGALLNNNEALTLSSVTISNCTTQASGGAISITSAVGSLSLNDSRLENNTATAKGGGIHVPNASNVSVIRCTVSGNVAGKSGGGIGFYFFGNLTLIDSTISGNKAGQSLLGSYGGGVLVPVIATIRNCTITSNSALYGAGILTFSPSQQISIQNSTITQNTANSSGGGLYVNVNSSQPISLISTIVAQNIAPSGPDILGKVTGNFDLIGNTLGATIVGANNKLNVDPQLGPLADNGGPTMTRMPLSGSPCIDAGSNPSAIAFDQRGKGFGRAEGAAADIGAFEIHNVVPGAIATASNVTVPGGTAQSIQVTFNDDAGIDVSTLGTGDIRISGPNGFSAVPAFIGVDVATNGTPRSATYSLIPPGGFWSADDIGLYSVVMVNGEVSDTDLPMAHFVAAGTIGSFIVAASGPYIVTNTNDSGPGSLRQTVLHANAAPGADSIVFDATAFANPQTITLASGQMSIADALTITGPAAQVTINANQTGRIFNVDVAGQSRVAIAINRLTLTRGNSVTGSGGAILNNDEALALSDVKIDNNSGLAGGAIAVIAKAGSLSMSDCQLTGNWARSVGGAIFAVNGSAVSIARCTISANTANRSGGGVYVAGDGTLNVTDSTFSGNKIPNTASTGFGGGGVCIIDSNVVIRNSTISNNSANANGGGISASGTAQLLIQNSTVAQNTATGSGGGIAQNDGSIVTLASTLVALNIATDGPDVGGTVTADHSLIGNTVGATLTGANNKLNIDPLLAPLTNNGGTTQTHSLLLGSPAINAGSNPANLVTEQRSIGYHRLAGGSVDIGAYEFQTAAKVTNVTINSTRTGVERSQRSRVIDVAITFDQLPTFVGGISNAAAAFSLTRVSPTPGSVTLAASVKKSELGTIVTLTFIGGAVDNISLADGRYALRALAAQFATGLDGDSNGIGGDDFVFDEPSAPAALDLGKIFRIYGDFTGDGSVATNDLIQIRLPDGGSNFLFDFDNGGGFGLNDWIQFRLRFGGSI